MANQPNPCGVGGAVNDLLKQGAEQNNLGRAPEFWDENDAASGEYRRPSGPRNAVITLIVFVALVVLLLLLLTNCGK